MISLKDPLPVLTYLHTMCFYFPLFTVARLVQMGLIIHNWDFQWKMNFDQILLNKLEKYLILPHPPLVSNNINVTQSIYQTYLDSKLTFENHIKVVA